MSDVRCPACGAVVPATAQWCSLCYAVLRQPEPVREPVAVASQSAPQGSPVELGAVAGVEAPVAAPADPVYAAAAAAAESGVSALPSAGATTESVGRHAGPPAADEPRWPCPRCGERVPMSLDSCNSCGAGFLAGAADRLSAKLPVVGDVARMSSGQRWMVIGTGGFLFMLLLILVATLGGHLF